MTGEEFNRYWKKFKNHKRYMNDTEKREREIPANMQSLQIMRNKHKFMRRNLFGV